MQSFDSAAISPFPIYLQLATLLNPLGLKYNQNALPSGMIFTWAKAEWLPVSLKPQPEGLRSLTRAEKFGTFWIFHGWATDGHGENEL
jgi:hypothetical protein